ncbi:LITAF-like zinc ribbon domain-containing protein [Aspergillus homomorphus CBS 101889]|uniref:LITAF domain-containing protein n=1 Tax=Aspergillus homomorphus (strain CBS 101889) TaxID=1450537 RepID=A0A395I3Z3_ASPHC|nr:hypothetical protein BO97DRAFT_422391 [Aspergillus homomorphus CBS 101889]RAL14485.1 hypothetical protein BO97DRAFT_422391 [Aspergillus homomorphus CBS 101889]
MSEKPTPDMSIVSPEDPSAEPDPSSAGIYSSTFNGNDKPIVEVRQPDESTPRNTHPPSGYNTATPLHALQRGPAPVDCPVCRHREMTRVQPEAGNTTHAWAAVACICCCLGCVPYMLSSLKDEHHYCGKCGTLLATWYNSGRTDVRKYN